MSQPPMKLYIKGKEAYQLSLDFSGFAFVEEREDYVDRCKEWLKYKFRKSMTITDDWEIVIEGIEASTNLEEEKPDWNKIIDRICLRKPPAG